MVFVRATDQSALPIIVYLLPVTPYLEHESLKEIIANKSLMSKLWVPSPRLIFEGLFPGFCCQMADMSWPMDSPMVCPQTASFVKTGQVQVEEHAKDHFEAPKNLLMRVMMVEKDPFLCKELF